MLAKAVAVLPIPGCTKANGRPTNICLALLSVMLMVGLVWRRRTHASDLKGHTNGARLLEVERGRERLALLQRLFEVEEHQMIGGRSERHRALGWNWQSV